MQMSLTSRPTLNSTAPAPTGGQPAPAARDGTPRSRAGRVALSPRSRLADARRGCGSITSMIARRPLAVRPPPIPLCIRCQLFRLRPALSWHPTRGAPAQSRDLAHTRDCRSSARGRLRSFCGPFLRPLRSVCGLQTNEQPQTRANSAPAKPSVFAPFRPYSRLFAVL